MRGPVAARGGRAARSSSASLANELFVVLTVWLALAVGELASARLGDQGLVAFGIAATGLLWIRAPVPARTRAARPALANAALGLVAGYASHPAWLTLIGLLGLALGLSPVAATVAQAPEALDWLAKGIAAPLTEELLYRERLLPMLRERIGTRRAVLAASTLFALPHWHLWSLLGTFVVGVALGFTYLRAQSLSLCVAIHAGLNLAGLEAAWSGTASGGALAAGSLVGLAAWAAAVGALRLPRFGSGAR